MGAMVDVLKLTGLLRRLDTADPAGWAALLAPAMERHGITSPLRIAAFMPNACHESGGLRSLRENLNYAAQVLPTLFKGRITAAEAARVGRSPGRAADQLGIAAIIYGGAWGEKNLGNRPGTSDAADCIGRGLMQLTGRANYEKLAKATGRRVEALAPWLETREGAVESAAAFWEWRGCNTPADRGDIATCRRLVNGGTFGLDEVEELYATARAYLGT